MSNPTTQFPFNKIFGGVKFFKHFPYALPTIVTGALGGVATICNLIFIREVRLFNSKSLARKLTQV